MAQYKTGTVTVTNGSAVVTGSGTAWLANVNPGDGFVVKGVPVPYTVASVNSNAQLTLSAAWSDASQSGAIYAVFRDFTTNYDLPELSQGDIETATIWTRALRQIDQLQAASVVEHEAAPDPHPQYLLDTRYEQDRLREALLREATLNLDFANNKYEVYEGPVDSLTQRPFNDILDFSRDSSASARNATGGISEVLADQQRLVGNRGGLLIEEQRTNVLDYSEDLSSWSIAGTVPIDENALMAPDGTLSMDRVTINDSDRLFETITVSPNTPLSLSFWIDPQGETRSLFINRTSQSTGGQTGEWVVDLSLINGLTRIDASHPSVTVNAPFVSGSGGETGVIFAANLANDVTFGLWGIQLEQGSFPTSYIKTEGSQVTRAADSCSRTLGAEFNAKEGTLIVEADALKNGRITSLGGAGVNRIRILQGTGVATVLFQDADSVINSVSINGSEAGYGKNKRFAYSYKVGQLIFAMQGKALEKGLQRLPTVSELEVGRDDTDSGYINDTVHSIRYIPRALSASELEALTS